MSTIGESLTQDSEIRMEEEEQKEDKRREKPHDNSLFKVRRQYEAREKREGKDLDYGTDDNGFDYNSPTRFIVTDSNGSIKDSSRSNDILGEHFQERTVTKNIAK